MESENDKALVEQPQPGELHDIRLESVASTATSVSEASETLSCIEMWLDTIKAMKMFCDPVSDCVGSTLGFLCCVATIAANDEDNRNSRATRHDVLYAHEIRRRKAEEANCAFRIGFFAGDTTVDCVSSTIGAIVGAPRAALLSCTGNNARNNTVLGYQREAIDEVDLFDSCAPACCFGPS